MSDTYLFLVFLLFALAIVDLVVGVSNDAVNFLNSAVGSRVAPRHIVMIVASLGIFIGAGFSSGMMEVARKGIFNPDYFYFDEIMIIFAAVMLTDILLLDLFNTLALPTSTTVSIVFELLGAAVVVSLIKITQANEGLDMLSEYINTAQALTIISGIFLSIAVAFTVGVAVQYLSRLLFSFQYRRRMKYIGALWAGFALSALTYFLLIKGVKGAAFIPPAAADWIQTHTALILIGSFVAWTALLQVLLWVWRVNVLRIVVLFGTFALAMAFAGNDLVNFIGVPLAGFDAFTQWSGSGLAPGEMTMEVLSQPVRSSSYFLLLAGAVMVLTLWFSRKARAVTETEVNLGRQHTGAERFAPNALSRGIVRVARQVGKATQNFLPASWQAVAAQHFSPVEKNDKQPDPPAFDLVRASVNLTVASMLISLATSFQLPLSTTYVSFMVAMGSSLADKAWGRDSAVYRVAGVLHVIAGWFFTALIAFTAAGLFALVIHGLGIWGIGGLLILAGVFIVRGFRFHRKKEQAKEHSEHLSQRTAKLPRPEVQANTLHKVSESLQIVQKAYGNALQGLIREDRSRLRDAREAIQHLQTQNEALHAQLFTLIQKIAEKQAESSRLYLLVYDIEQDLLQSASLVVDACHTHVANLHSPLTPAQAASIARLQRKMNNYYEAIRIALRDPNPRRFEKTLYRKLALLEQVEVLLADQVKGIKAGDYSEKNSQLMFRILLETKDLTAIGARFVKLYYRQPEFVKKKPVFA